MLVVKRLYLPSFLPFIADVAFMDEECRFDSRIMNHEQSESICCILHQAEFVNILAAFRSRPGSRPIQTKCSYIPGIPHDHCNLLIRSNAAQEEAEKEEDHGSKEAREAKEGSERRLGSIPDGCGKL